MVRPRIVIQIVMIGAVFWLLVATSVFASDANQSPWSTIADRDIDFIYKTLQENHPGAVDAQNTWFKKYLDDGYQAAKQDSARISSYTDYEAIIERYVGGFKDGHLSANFLLTRKEDLWTRFLISRRGNDYIVVFSDLSTTAEPRIGWKIVACDLMPIADIMTRYVFPFRRGSSDLEADWFVLSPWALQGESSQWRPKFKSCEFVVNGKSRSVNLDYQKIDTRDLAAKVRTVNLGSNRRFGASKFSKNSIWIVLPSFHPEGDDLKDIQEIVKSATTYRSANFIVFDLRGNTGGSSLWGRDILSGIYGDYFKGLADQAEKQAKTYSEWRVSKGNLAHLEQIAPWLKERHGADSEGYKVFSKTAEDMRAALSGQQSYVKQADLDAITTDAKPNQSAKSASKAKLILLTDGYCASACLDFMDMALLAPGAIHVGGTTKADTVYMDVRNEMLPSGLTRLGFAAKVYRNRSRGHNVAYKPSAYWNGSFADTDALKNWIARTVMSHP